MVKELQVFYFAILREQRGLGQEQLSTHQTTARELYEELRRAHPFTLGPDRLRVAIDDELADWETPLRDHQRIAFIPPVAGG